MLKIKIPGPHPTRLIGQVYRSAQESVSVILMRFVLEPGDEDCSRRADNRPRGVREGGPLPSGCGVSHVGLRQEDRSELANVKYGFFFIVGYWVFWLELNYF